LVQQFIAIIAKSKSGKSTLIKTLTGCPTSSYHGFVEDELTGERIFVVCGSPQELPLSLTELRELLKAASSDPNCRGVVIAIQPTRPHSRLSMETIFQEVTKCGGFELNAFIVDPERSGKRANVADIRSRLSAFAAKTETLDGRRFALTNAQIINDVTRVVPVGGGEEMKKAAASAAGKK
jgi:energy-coupling factor transporter ATP-binding protein EcfA2